MLIFNGVIHTMDGETIDSGFVQVKGTAIVQVGHMSQLPPGAELDHQVIDARGGHVLPGLLDIHCHLGLYGSGTGFEGDDLNEAHDPCTPQLRALDAVNPLDPDFREARRAGVTTVLTGPGSANPIAGQSVLLKTTGRVVDRMVVRAPACMKFALGENPKTTYHKRGAGPMTRMATAALIRETLTRASDYQLKWERAQASQEEDEPEFDAKLDALRPVMSGRLPAHFHAHRADDIVTATRLAREFGLECVIVHGTEGHLIADYLAKEGVPVITGPCLTHRSKPELAHLTMENTAVLAQAGVQVAICTDHPETPIQHLLLCAALAAREGMDEEEALAAITCNPAKICGIDDRVGSLEMGKDADFVVFRANPLSLSAKPEMVYISGKRVR